MVGDGVVAVLARVVPVLVRAEVVGVAGDGVIWSEIESSWAWSGTVPSWSWCDSGVAGGVVRNKVVIGLVGD